MFNFGFVSQPTLLRVYPCLFSQGSLVAVLGDPTCYQYVQSRVGHMQSKFSTFFAISLVLWFGVNLEHRNWFLVFNKGPHVGLHLPTSFHMSHNGAREPRALRPCYEIGLRPHTPKARIGGVNQVSVPDRWERTEAPCIINIEHK